jgi:CheY-like chemotaxis protein
MPKRILWFDNDRAYLIPFVDALTDEGYQVEVAEDLTEAEQFLNKSRYDLVILDVMIPTKSELEETRYRPEETDLGYKTGLIFYGKLKTELAKLGTRTMVMTVRLDKAIMDEFIKSGLPPAAYATKYEMSDPLLFLRKIHSVLENQEQPQR